MPFPSYHPPHDCSGTLNGQHSQPTRHIQRGVGCESSGVTVGGHTTQGSYWRLEQRRCYLGEGRRARTGYERMSGVDDEQEVLVLQYVNNGQVK